MSNPSSIALGNVSQGAGPKSHSSTLAFNETWLAFKHHIESGRNFRRQKDPLLGQTENQNAWPKLSKSLLDYDAARIGSYSDDIDTFLVFAGLFSAILTAFSIEAYKLLQRDPTEASLQLLSQVSQQLNSFSVNQQFVNSSYQPPTSLDPYNPPHSAIIVNILWFLSLVLSLTTASLIMMVKQWLREYLSYDSTSPQAQARVRFYRHQELRRWNVFEIAELLPSFLQVALGFFSVALSIFLRMFNTMLSDVIVAGITLWFSFYGLTILGPMLSSSCPYKSPFLKSATHSVRHSIRRHLRALLRSRPLLHFLPSYLIPNPLLEDGNIQTSTTQDGLIWTQADNIFFDDQLIKDTIHMCLSEIQGWDVVRCVRGVIERRALRKEPGRLGNHGQDYEPCVEGFSHTRNPHAGGRQGIIILEALDG